jgi:tripartite-type tricarboxylate transporter receptor subunit TctC
MRSQLSRGVALAVLMSATALAWAQSGPGGFPNRAVRVIVPAAVGSLTDPVARIVAEDMGRRTGQNWVVENRPGAGGIIGTDATAKAAPDGYTLMLTANNFIITPSFYRNVTYKVPGDFALIGMVGRGDNLLVASAASGIRDIADLVARAKASSSPINYTSPLIGSAAHLTVELFKRRHRTQPRGLQQLGARHHRHGCRAHPGQCHGHQYGLALHPVGQAGAACLDRYAARP